MKQAPPGSSSTAKVKLETVQVLMMRRKQESGEGDNEPQPMVEDFAQNRPDRSGAGEKQCLASANPPAAIAQRQAAVTATPTAAQIAASKEPAPGQPLSVDIPSKDSLPEHHIQVCIALPAFHSDACRTGKYCVLIRLSPKRKLLAGQLQCAPAKGKTRVPPMHWKTWNIYPGAG